MHVYVRVNVVHDYHSIKHGKFGRNMQKKHSSDIKCKMNRRQCLLKQGR